MKPLIANKDTKALESAWARRLKIRDRHLCRFERKLGRGWRECGRRGTDAAHIYRRNQCGKAKFDDAVGLVGCRECHEAYDRYEEDVRVALDRKRVAWDTIDAVSRVNTLGPRP